MEPSGHESVGTAMMDALQLRVLNPVRLRQSRTSPAPYAHLCSDQRTSPRMVDRDHPRRAASRLSASSDQLRVGDPLVSRGRDQAVEPVHRWHLDVVRFSHDSPLPARGLLGLVVVFAFQFSCEQIC